MKRSAIIITLLVTLATVHVTKVPASAQATNVSGLWSGTTLVTPCAFASSGRCNAQNKITLKLTEQNSQITGSYTCATGTMVCRNGGADNTGNVQWGRISGNQLRLSLIMPADGSNCYYNGMLTSPSTMHGTYMCFNGASLVEEGTWDVKLASGQ
jgi:hypothetical protein